jgi:hypothetical protein
MIDETSTLEDICFKVAAALEQFGLSGVLTGGSAAAIYAPNAYASLDADFVLDGSPRRERLRSALETIGFLPSATAGMFHHPRSRFTIDFPKGPLAVGSDYVRETDTIERGGIRLRILTPTDCVRDRLAHFLYWSDYTALATAIAVTKARRESVDLGVLKDWVRRESRSGPVGHREKFQLFLERLEH